MKDKSNSLPHLRRVAGDPDPTATRDRTVPGTHQLAMIRHSAACAIRRGGDCTCTPVADAAFPPELSALARWVVWQRDPIRGKVPRDAAGHNCSATDPRQWLTHAAAVERQLALGADGLGLALADDPIRALDLDACRDPATGAVAPEALAILRELDSYAEVSPSGTGLRVFLRAPVPAGETRRKYVVPAPWAAPPGVTKTPQIEVFLTAGYVTVTGTHVVASPDAITERAEAFAAFYASHRPAPKGPTTGAHLAPKNLDLANDEVLAAVAAAHRDEYMRLFVYGETRPGKTASETDAAAIRLLAEQLGGDADRIEDILRRTDALRRPKWDEKRRLDGGSVGTLLRYGIERLLATLPAVSAEGGATGLRLRTLTELAENAANLAPVEAVVPYFAYRGCVVMLTAREKVGKSTLMTAAAAAVTRGRAFLDRPTVAGDVLWISADLERQADILQRADRFGADRDRFHVLYPRTFDDFDLALAQRSPVLVVVDTLARLVVGEVERASQPDDWGPVFSRFARAAQDRNLALVVDHHENKEGGYRDSTAIAGGADGLWTFKLGDAAGRRAVTTVARFQGGPPDRFAVELVGDAYRYVGPTGPAAPTADLGPRVLTYVTAHPGASQLDVIKVVGGRRQDVIDTLARLVDQGQLVDERRGQHHSYTVPLTASPPLDEDDKASF
jgi:hypothetical protein